MQLRELLNGVEVKSVTGDLRVQPLQLTTNSLQVAKGSLFIAVRGTQRDGHSFIEEAIEKGAAVVVSEEPALADSNSVVQVQVANSAEAASLIACNFYQHPSKELKVVGVTGTNGKTTIATVLYKLFVKLGYTCGLISTVENRVGELVLPSTHTTPDSLSLQQLLRQMVEAGCTYVFMEVSSHALHQHRVTGLQFTGAIFSNITHDHLDYHKTFEEYIRVKKSLFDHLPSTAFALSNADDKRGKVMLQNTAAKKLYYALKTLADYKGKILENGLEGLLMNVEDTEVHFRLIGAFNAYNLLAVYGAARALGEGKMEVLTALSEITGAPGRFECFVSPKEKVLVIVDYAHTPDALLNVLSTIKQLRTGEQQIITVTGCGGDRDRTKRPLMAAAVCTHSDRAIFTSDNPRSEDPAAIIRDMEEGVLAADRRKYIPVIDRREAIKTALVMARPQDIVLVAGKGHETYQLVKGEKEHFDDREEVKNWFTLLDK